MIRCDFCCPDAVLNDQYYREHDLVARTVDGRVICAVCFDYDLCGPHGHRHMADDEPCDYRPRLSSAWFDPRKPDEVLDLAKRAEEKQQSRERDAAALASGEKTIDDLRRENGLFAGLRVRPDFSAVLTEESVDEGENSNTYEEDFPSARVVLSPEQWEVFVKLAGIEDLVEDFAADSEDVGAAMDAAEASADAAEKARQEGLEAEYAEYRLARGLVRED